MALRGGNFYTQLSRLSHCCASYRFSMLVLLSTGWEMGFHNVLSYPVWLKYRNTGSQGIIRSRTGGTSSIKTCFLL